MNLIIIYRQIRRPLAVLAAALGLAALPTAARAQGPQIDTGEAPGVPSGAGKLGSPPGDPGSNKLGPAIGASGTSAFDTLVQGGPISGRVGPSVSRAPQGVTAPPPGNLSQGGPQFRVESILPSTIPNYGALEESGKPDDPGPPDGLTLDGAIALFLARNLDVLALKYEIPMAQADVLTASLLNNPIFYADTQLVPYGQYSSQRTGGPSQYDVNVTVPLDVNRKRRARVDVAQRAKRVTEAQLQDAIRNRIDNLYTVYVDVVAQRQALRLSQLSRKNLGIVLERTAARVRGDEARQPDLEAVRAQVYQADLQVRETSQRMLASIRALALQLNLTPAETDRLRVRATLRDLHPLPEPVDGLIRRGFERRPDLMAVRLGVGRADADIRLAEKNRLQDIYLLYQPYTFQNNQPFGLKSATSWAVGATVNMPIFNRNQGNIRRAQLNARQTRVELAAAERQAANEIVEAAREFESSRIAVLEFEQRILPAQRKVLDSARRRFEQGEAGILEYLDARKDYNELYRSYREALVRHRRAMLDLNTAVGERLVP